MTTTTFKATLYTINGWTILRLPDAASTQLPSRGQVMTAGTVNGVEFRTPLEPDGNGGHWLHVDKKLLAATKAQSGDTVTLSVESIKDWPEPVIPADWQAALDGDQAVNKQWHDITPMARWEWLRWIDSTAQAETRQRRIEVSCSKLLAGERRPCCFNRNMCCVPAVSKNGVLLQPGQEHLAPRVRT